METKVHRTNTLDAFHRVKNFNKLIEFPTVNDRTFWVGLPKDMRMGILEKGEEILKTEYPVLLLSDYTDFSRTGNRERFESKYFLRRNMLTNLVLAECVEDNGRFIDKILDGIYAILEETTWCLPAHNTYIRDVEQFIIPDEDRPIIDLFAAETASIIGLSEYLLRDRLLDRSWFINSYVDREIEKRILKPYLNYHFWWMGNGEEPMCNWTPWITQNVLLSVFTRREEVFERGLLKDVLRQASLSVDFFLDDYGDDGCCNEGAQYYSHAGLCLFGCIDLLNRITDNEMDNLYRIPLIKNIAAYIVKMYVGDGYYINYADCSPFPGKRSARDFLFGKYTENEGYASFAASDYRSMSLEEKLIFEERNLYYHILQLANNEEMMKYPEKAPDAPDTFFESVGLLIGRDEHFTFAVKAGNNGDSHNHNDVGSVTLYKDNKPLLIDLGVETYTKKTFSTERYEIWTMQSAFHNTVNFLSAANAEAPDIMQKDGKNFGAGDVKYKINNTECGLSMDIAPAYGDERIKSHIRTAVLHKENLSDSSTEIRQGSVVITDEYKESLTPVLTLMTYEKPELVKLSEGIAVIKVGALGEIKSDGISDVKIETKEITDERLKATWKHDCYRILLRLKDKKASTIIT
ncbi:MAG: heparinase II/III family protein [Lachnospiraceae bacterium]|nr:heparinase II/III family protein [Lachnospiraceae bacterium]